MENIDSGILSVPPELQVQIKKYLSDEDMKNYNLTSYLAGKFSPSIKELSSKCNCDVTNLITEQILKSVWYKCGNVHCVKYVLDKCGDQIKRQKYISCLEQSIKKGRFDIVKLIFKSGNVKSLTLRNINWLLKLAIKNGDIDMVKYMNELNKTYKLRSIKSRYTAPTIKLLFYDILKCDSLETIKYFFESEECKREIKEKGRMNYIENINLFPYFILEGGRLDKVKYFFEENGLRRILGGRILSPKHISGSIIRPNLIIKPEYIDIIKYLFEGIENDIGECLGGTDYLSLIATVRNNQVSRVIRFKLAKFILKKNGIRDKNLFRKRFLTNDILLECQKLEDFLVEDGEDEEGEREYDEEDEGEYEEKYEEEYEEEDEDGNIFHTKTVTTVVHKISRSVADVNLDNIQEGYNVENRIYEVSEDDNEDEDDEDEDDEDDEDDEVIPTCKGTTKKGLPCKNKVKNTMYCYLHM